MKKRININDCIIGRVLAEDIWSGPGVLIAAKDSRLNAYILDRLKTIGVQEVLIDITDDKSENYNRQVKAIQGIILELASGKPLDMNKVEEISSSLFFQMYNDVDIVKLLEGLKGHDDYTYQHSINVAVYSMLIGRWMGFDEKMIRQVGEAGLLHDIGKAKLPLELINKAGSLTTHELEIVQRHPQLGYELIESIQGMDRAVKKGVLMHHERVDGSGYPSKVTGEEIHIFARIVSVADVFDAMTSDRVYKKRITPFQAFVFFEAQGVALFDATVWRKFLTRVTDCYTGSKVLLNNGNEGKIVYIPLHDPACPIIRIGDALVDLNQEKNLQIVRMI